MKSFDHKKRIVYTALKPYFEDERLMQALVLWEQKYANAPSSAVHHFVNELKKTVPASGDMRAAHLNLVKTASLPESTLLDYPTEQMKSYIAGKKISGKVTYVLPELDALRLFIATWQSYFLQHTKRSIVTFVIDNISSQNIDPTLSNSYLSWLTGRDDKIRLSNVETSDLRKIINLFYVGSCEYLGPVKSDEVMGEVVAEFKQKYPKLEKVLAEKLL